MISFSKDSPLCRRIFLLHRSKGPNVNVTYRERKGPGRAHLWRDRRLPKHYKMKEV